MVSGLNYVKILQDTNGDGRADQAINFADGPKTGAQGMYFYGRDLLCAGDQGLLRYRDRNGDEVQFNRGPTWIALIPTGSPYSWR